MTYQGGPNDPRNSGVRRGRDYIRRDDGSWNVIPIVLGLIVLLGLGYMLLGHRDDRAGPARTTERIDRPATPADLRKSSS
jgi:hypothetical protein